MKNTKIGFLILMCGFLAACGKSTEQAQLEKDAQITAGGGKERLPCVITNSCTIDDMGLTLEQYNKKHAKDSK
ncbi:MAG: hypothetical protein WC208_04365 [Gallionella sp.]